LQGPGGSFDSDRTNPQAAIFSAAHLAVGRFLLDDESEPKDLVPPSYKTVPLFTQDSTAAVSDHGLVLDMT
jgi:hypothetical protein